MSAQSGKEQWGSRLGVIMAVAGSAVGLGNFLRFPGQVAQYGGAAFMIAYFVSLLLLGIPIAWVEWAMGRKGGTRGFNSCPGILWSLTGSRSWKYAGLLGVLIPVCIYFYYICIEVWCLGYAIKSVTGGLSLTGTGEFQQAFAEFTGLGADGSAFSLDHSGFLPYYLIVAALNFWLIYRGLSKGIELFCKIAIPMLLVLSGVILVRVLTLGMPDPAIPTRSVDAGMGFMWNPDRTVLEHRPAGADSSAWKTAEMVPPTPEARQYAEKLTTEQPQNYRIRQISLAESLKNPSLWLAAAGQIFFTLTVGFGAIMTYASYLKKNDDVALSSLTACSANEFCEVGLGGMLTVPPAIAFLGASVAVSSVFSLGFMVLPQVFALMPGGMIFGGLFFFLLFLAAVTSSLSMLQPGIAFLEESMGIKRHQSVTILAAISVLGSFLVAWFSKDLQALASLDFWVGNVSLYLLATLQVILFGWVIGIRKGFTWIDRGAAIRVPKLFGFIIKYVTPLMLVTIFLSWLYQNLVITQDDSVKALMDGQTGTLVGVALIGFVGIFLTLILKNSKSYRSTRRTGRLPDQDSEAAEISRPGGDNI